VFKTPDIRRLPVYNDDARGSAGMVQSRDFWAWLAAGSDRGPQERTVRKANVQGTASRRRRRAGRAKPASLKEADSHSAKYRYRTAEFRALVERN